MAKMTLIEIVQDILNDMNSDPVDTISDTEESVQVAQIVKTTFFNLMREKHWPHLQAMAQLESSGDSDLPTHMTLPEYTQRLLWLRYDKKTSATAKKAYSKVNYLDTDEFMNYLNQRDSTSDNVTTVTDSSGVDLLVRNDLHPVYWTTFDDENIVMDAYYSDLDNTLQKSKTQAHIYKEPVWVHTDLAVPDLPAKLFSLLLEESKSAAFLALKETPNNKAEQRSQRQRTWVSLEARKTGQGIQWPDYGRK